ncbi:MAG: HlyD family efflux transporter periplasmic adaptor subunit [Phenylobacterium sp.]|nr:MAG: HlyD family efflux transporter periplasmic adaptor subunit [Phenylobacterium sp.]
MSDTTTATATGAATSARSGARSSRRRLLTLLAAVVVVGVVAYGVYALLFAGRSVATDNAYVGAEVAQVTPLVSGPVAQVPAKETQTVRAGQPLVILDDADARIAVAQAEAALGQAERKVQAYEASDTALAGQQAARQADLQRAQADLARSRTDLDRRQNLASSGAVSGEELTTAKDQFAQAQAAIAQAQANVHAAQGQREANSVLIAGVSLEQNPEVAAARSRLDAAKLALSRTVIRAPLDGVVSKKTVQVGQQVQAGAPLMAVVPITAAYVDANFKEGQLRKVRVGQPVTLTSDLYGGGVVFHGRVTGLSGGTGSAFSLIPAQNASGNWIKVVQRLPVRIALDPRELAQHPLRVGLSMKTKIDISDAR